MAGSVVCKSYRHLVYANRDKRVTLDSYNLEVVERFPNLGDVLNSVGGVQEAVKTRI